MEELKQITEMIVGLGGEAKSAFIVYIAYLLIKQIFITGIVVTVIVYATRVVKFIAYTVSFKNAVSKVIGIPMYGDNDIGTQSRFLKWLSNNFKEERL